MSYWEGYTELRGLSVYVVAQVAEISPDYDNVSRAEIEIESVEGPDLEMLDLTRAEESEIQELVCDRYFAEVAEDMRNAS